MAHANAVGWAVVGALGAVVVNNLPAAVLLSANAPPHARFLLIGLNIGPNLAVTGSLSALIWWRGGDWLAPVPPCGGTPGRCDPGALYYRRRPRRHADSGRLSASRRGGSVVPKTSVRPTLIYAPAWRNRQTQRT